MSIFERVSTASITLLGKCHIPWAAYSNIWFSQLCFHYHYKYVFDIFKLLNLKSTGCLTSLKTGGEWLCGLK